MFVCGSSTRDPEVVIRRTQIVGCGDIGTRVAAHYAAAGRPVTGWVRTAGSARALGRAGVMPVVADLDAAAGLPAEGGSAACIFYFAPPPREGEDDPRLQRFLEHMALPPDRLVYISTSAVYGDCGGAWVDESTPIRPGNARGRRRAAAEARLRAWSAKSGTPVVILRVPGIYGPGRLPVARLKQGLPVLRREDSGYINRIHADDLAAAAVAAAERGRAGAVYNISDGHPAAMSDYFDCVADALHLPRPPRVSWAEAERVLTPAMLSFLRDSRRLCNRRMREELDLQLRYPDFHSGVLACVAGDQ